MFIPDAIFFEENVKEYELGKRLLDIYEKQKVPMTIIENHNNIEEMRKKENANNTFEYQDISNDDIINEYLNKYKKLCIAKPDMAYNYLEKEYREKRFGNVDGFKEYVKNRND